MCLSWSRTFGKQPAMFRLALRAPMRRRNVVMTHVVCVSEQGRWIPGMSLVCREELALWGLESLAQPELQQHGMSGGDT